MPIENELPIRHGDSSRRLALGMTLWAADSDRCLQNSPTSPKRKRSMAMRLSETTIINRVLMASA